MIQHKLTAKADAALMSADDAKSLRASHDAHARKLSKTSKTELHSIYASELLAHGARLLAGGPVSRDELVNAILTLRYPQAQMDLSTHVLYHETDGWTACQYCHPHSGARCECGLGRSDG